MNLDELRTFLEVVDTGNLVTAARRLNVTPSTVTARINGLEEEIGQKLLHRNKSGAELTSPGFKFKRYAEVMVQLWGQALSEVSLPRGFEGVCNVGLDFDLWNGFGQHFLAHVRETNPGIALAFWPGEQRMIDRWLSIGLVDIAFCYAPQAGERFASRVLFDDELILVSLDEMDQPRLDATYVYVDHGDEFRRQHAAAFPGDVTSALVIASSDWALDHLLASGGSGYLPRRHVADALKRGELRAVKNAPAFTRRVHVVENAQTVRGWAWYGPALVAAASR
ncbi:LysR family transcriptional regulator [Aestuariivirga sp.]|uniref:LysR family transcriptional regulator n=1 Tax=Aestuariivirga sp. TaxID=2650926 RepID=UPI0035939665